MAPLNDPAARSDVLLDPAGTDWVMVKGRAFFFEPWGAEFAPVESGSVVVAFGDDETHHRGVEVTPVESGEVSIWMPAGAKAFWLPDAARDTAPWETHLTALDYQRGTLL